MSETVRLSHFSHKSLTKINSVPVRDQKADWKPRGLWVSVDGEMDWEEWCRSEEYGHIDKAIKHPLRLTDRANIIWLRDLRELDAFHDEYAVEAYPQLSISLKHIDWRRVARAYDGIIIAPYQWERRLAPPISDWYYTWDCASGCIWNAKAIALLELANATPQEGTKT